VVGQPSKPLKQNEKEEEDLTKQDTDKKQLPSFKHNTIKIWRFEYE
jgi:hypothetical protein